MDVTAKSGTHPHQTPSGATPVLPRNSAGKVLVPIQQLHLTERTVRDLQPIVGQRYEVKDQKAPYLRLRVSENSKTWSVLRRRRGGRMIRAKLGDWPEMSCERARAAALRTAGDLGDGVDVNQQRREARAETRRQGLSLQDVLEEYIQVKGATLRESTAKSYRSDLQNSCPDWLTRPITSITPELVAKRHTERVKISPARANGFVRVVRALVRFGNRRHKLNIANPATELSENRTWARVKRRRTVLAEKDIPQWVRAVKALPDDPVKHTDRNEGQRELPGTQRDALLLLACTALRLREATQLCWPEVNFNSAQLEISSRNKGHREHLLPIGPAMLRMLHRRYRDRRSDRWVFPGVSPDRPLDRISARILAQITRSDGSVIEFTAHDLRRTALTLLERADVSGYAIKRIANHAMQDDVTEGYINDDSERLRAPVNLLEKLILGSRRYPPH